MKKVSIIIPAYNAEKYLENCYKSILDQSYQNFEVVTVNDASSDGTLEIMNKYAKKDSRFVAIDMPHGGVSVARNTGLEAATGYYIQFVDADDTLNPKMIEKMVGIVEQNDADLAICRFNHPYFKTYCGNKVFDLSKKEDFVELFQDTFALTVPWNKIWKRSCITEKFDSEVRFSEDELFNLANLVNAKKVVTTSEYLYNYYVDPENSSSCISGIVKTKEFWKTKSSIYFLGASLVPKRKAILERAIAENKIPVKNINSLLFVRALDYYFVQLPVYVGLNVSENALVHDLLATMTDANFRAAFRAERRNGIVLKFLGGDTKKALAKKFVRCCSLLCKEKCGDDSFKLTDAIRTLFLVQFADQFGKLNALSLNAKLLLNFKKNQTIEANYVRGILDYDSVFANNSSVVLGNSCLERLSV